MHATAFDDSLHDWLSRISALRGAVICICLGRYFPLFVQEGVGVHVVQCLTEVNLRLL